MKSNLKIESNKSSRLGYKMKMRRDKLTQWDFSDLQNLPIDPVEALKIELEWVESELNLSNLDTKIPKP